MFFLTFPFLFLPLSLSLRSEPFLDYHHFLNTNTTTQSQKVMINNSNITYAFPYNPTLHPKHNTMKKKNKKLATILS